MCHLACVCKREVQNYAVCLAELRKSCYQVTKCTDALVISVSPATTEINCKELCIGNGVNERKNIF